MINWSACNNLIHLCPGEDYWADFYTAVGSIMSQVTGQTCLSMVQFSNCYILDLSCFGIQYVMYGILSTCIHSYKCIIRT